MKYTPSITHTETLVEAWRATSLIAFEEQITHLKKIVEGNSTLVHNTIYSELARSHQNSKKKRIINERNLISLMWVVS